MSAAEVVDGEVVSDEPSREVAVRPTVTLVPTTTAHDLVQRLDVIRGAMDQAMQKDVDYGVIPGTGKKPTLLKPGAEKLAVLFQLDVQLENEKTWHDDGHLTVVSRATVYHIPSGARVASGEGICTTREGKYAYRQGERVCPACSQPTIIKGKAEYGGGWVCFKKKGGCGTKFPDGDPLIEGQAVGKVPNDNIADTYNTVDKMASKRARVDAVLAATGASALFTQDVEDLGSEATGAQPGSGTGVHRGAPPSVPTDASPEEWDGWFPPPDEVAGEGASTPETPTPADGGSPAPVISDSQRRRLRAIQRASGVTDEKLKAMVWAIAGVTSSKDIPRDKYDALISAVEAEAPEGSTFAARADAALAARAAQDAQGDAA